LNRNRQTDIQSSVKDSAGWHDLEPIIRDAEGDALLIFDCCQAGSLIFQDGRSISSSRSFECIGACDSKSTTKFPGPNSFTTALVWALTEFAKEKNDFTTVELQMKIMSAPNFPKEQFVQIGERNEHCDQRIILSPVSTSSKSDSSVPTASREADDPPHNFIDLRLWFSHRPNCDEVEQLAKRLRRLQIDKILNAQRIDWRGLKNFEQDRREKVVRPAADKWLSLLKPGRKSISQAAHTNDHSSMTGEPSSSAGDFGEHTHTHNFSVPDTRSEHHNRQEANTLQKIRDNNMDSLSANEGSEDGREHPLSTGPDFTQHEKDESLRHDESNTGKGLELVNIGVRGILSSTVEKAHPIFKLAAVLSLGACLWYTFPLGRLFAFSTS